MTKTIRFGVIGCGGIGPTHCGAIRQIAGAELVAVADPIEERARRTAQKFDVPRIYATDTELLQDPQIDAVCLCTPSGIHVSGALAALEAGKHVVVEKPMDVSVEACDRLIAAADRTGKVVTIISQHRFDAASVLVKQAIDAGKLGRIVLADAAVKWWRTQAYYDSGDWRGTWAMDGGGALMNQGVHTVDVLQWLVSGQARVTHVFGQVRTAAHERIEVEDTAVATLMFSNGAIGSITATTCAVDGFPVRIDVYGTEGTAIIEGDRLKLLRLNSGEEFASESAAIHALSVAKGGTASVREESATRLTDSTAAADPGAIWGDAHRAQIEDFIHAIRAGTRPLIDARAGKVPVEIILATYRSARTGVPVTL